MCWWMDAPVPAVHTSTDSAWVHNKYQATTCLFCEQNALIGPQQLSSNHLRFQASSFPSTEPLCHKHNKTIRWNHLRLVSVCSLMDLADEVLQLPAHQHIWILLQYLPLINVWHAVYSPSTRSYQSWLYVVSSLRVSVCHVMSCLSGVTESSLYSKYLLSKYL